MIFLMKIGIDINDCQKSLSIALENFKKGIK